MNGIWLALAVLKPPDTQLPQTMNDLEPRHRLSGPAVMKYKASHWLQRHHFHFVGAGPTHLHMME